MGSVLNSMVFGSINHIYQISWIENVVYHISIDVVYVNFGHTFDSVIHACFLERLKSFSHIMGSLVLLEGFRTGRRHMDRDQV